MWAQYISKLRNVILEAQDCFMSTITIFQEKTDTQFITATDQVPIFPAELQVNYSSPTVFTTPTHSLILDLHTQNL